jgi:death-on-curing protein
MTIWLTIEDFEYLCFNLARELMSQLEPIPDYNTHNIALLDSALAAPRQTFSGKFLYPTLAKQGAILFYSLIKNHPFENGNKRIAVMSLLVFLRLNNKWIDMVPYNLYLLAKKVAKSDRKHQKKTQALIEHTIENFLVDIESGN